MTFMLMILALTLVAVGAARLGALWSQWRRQRQMVRAFREAFERDGRR